MGVAALIISLVAILFGILPLIYTQLVGIVVGILGVVLGVWGLRHAREHGQRTGSAMTGIVLGAIAIVLSGLLYGTLIYSGKRVGDEMVRKIGSEFQDSSQRGGAEFREALEQAIRTASTKNLIRPTPERLQPVPAKAPPPKPAPAPVPPAKTAPAPVPPAKTAPAKPEAAPSAKQR